MSKSNINADLANLKTNGVLTPVAGWDNVPVIDTDGLGGAGGPMNAQAQALANKFAYLESADGTSKVGHVVGASQVSLKNFLDNNGFPSNAFSTLTDGITYAFSSGRDIILPPADVPLTTSITIPEGVSIKGKHGESRLVC